MSYLLINSQSNYEHTNKSPFKYINSDNTVVIRSAESLINHFLLKKEIKDGSPGCYIYDGFNKGKLNKNKCLLICEPTSDRIKKLKIWNQDLSIQNLKVFLVSYQKYNLAELIISMTTINLMDIKLAMNSAALSNLKRLNLSDNKI